MLTPPNPQNYPVWKFYMDLLQMVGTIAVFIYVWWSNREKVTSQRFASLEKKVGSVESTLKNVPICCNGHESMATRVDGHNNRLGQHKELIVKMEGEFKSLPKKDDLEAVYERVNKVSSQMSDLRHEVGKISGALPGLTHITEVMNKFLLEHGGKQ